MEEEEKKPFNIILLGDGYVGKSSIMQALQENDFQEQVATIKKEYEFQKIFQNKSYNLKIIDTAGQEEYDHIRKKTYIEGDVFLLCFSLVDETSYKNILSRWLPHIKQYNIEPIILVGTKLDLRNSSPESINKKKGEKLQKKISAIYYVESSAKTKVGMDEIVDKIVLTLTLEKPSKRSCVLQ